MKGWRNTMNPVNAHVSIEAHVTSTGMPSEVTGMESQAVLVSTPPYKKEVDEKKTEFKMRPDYGKKFKDGLMATGLVAGCVACGVLALGLLPFTIVGGVFALGSAVVGVRGTSNYEY
jgi:hypothetical protein